MGAGWLETISYARAAGDDANGGVTGGLWFSAYSTSIGHACSPRCTPLGYRTRELETRTGGVEAKAGTTDYSKSR